MNELHADCACPRARHCHGLPSTYARHACRCPECVRAKSRRYKEWDLRSYRGQRAMRPAVGSRRRLQALACLGWGSGDLARRLGTSQPTIVHFWNGGTTNVSPSFARRVAAVYDQLWDKPSANRYRVKTIRLAQRNRWAPPLAWDDETIDNPKARPQHMLTAKVKFKHGDVVARAEHVAVLTRAGLSAREIADRLGTTPRNVSRDRARTREAAT